MHCCCGLIYRVCDAFFQLQHHAAQHQLGVEPHRRGGRRHSAERDPQRQHLHHRAQSRQLWRVSGDSKVCFWFGPVLGSNLNIVFICTAHPFRCRILQAKVSENRASMTAKSQKAWVPGSLDAKPPAPPVKPPWQVQPLSPLLLFNRRRFLKRRRAVPALAFSPLRRPSLLCDFSTQPVPIIRKLETTSRDGELIPRTHPGPANMGDRFRHAFLADPIHDRHIKPPSLAKPSNRFAPDLAR